MNIPVNTDFRAVWLPASQNFTVADNGSTSAEDARVGGTPADGDEITGGTPPYTIASMSFVGGAPTPGITLTQTTTTITDDTVKITSAPGVVVGGYAGTIRAVVVDSSPDPQAIEVDLPYLLKVTPVNSWEVDILALVDHYWPLDEASGVTFADAVGAFDMVLAAATDHWHQGWLSGVRADPAVYGMWKANQIRPNPVFAGGEPVAGYTTGGLGCWFTLSPNTSGDKTLIACNYANNTARVQRLYVDASERLIYECEGFSLRRISIETASGFVQPGVPYFVVVEQPADGGGLNMYVDGVDLGLTTTLAGGAAIDDFVAQTLTPGGPFTATQTQLGGNGSAGADGAFLGCVGGAFLNRNNVLGPTNIAALFGAGVPNIEATDYHEFVQDLAAAREMVLWHGGAFQGDNSQGLNMAPLATLDKRATAFATPPSVQNTPDNAGTGLQVESRYNMLKQIYGTNNPTYFAIATATDWEPTAGRLKGTVVVNVTVNAVPDGIRKIIWAFGTLATNSMEFGVIGTASGWKVFFRAFESTVETYRVLSPVIQLGGTWFGQIGVVQRGSGPELYVNGVKNQDAPVIQTSPDVWVPTFGNNSDERWGGEIGSASVDNWQPGELHQFHGFIEALDDGLLLELYEASTGVVDGPTFLNDIDDYITSLVPTHRYRFNEASGAILDVGAGTAIDCANIGAASYQTGGPDDSTDGITSSAADHFRNLTLNWGTPGTGTLIAFIRNVGQGNTILAYSNTSNEVNTFSFGIGVQGIATSNRVNCILTTTNTVNYRYWSADDVDVSSWNLDGQWHMVAFVQTGSVMRINIDGVDVVVTETALGASPPSASWFADANDANSRAVLCNNRVAGSSGSLAGNVSEVQLYDGVQLTEAQLAGMAQRIRN